MYPEWRDPKELFAALRRLIDRDVMDPDLFGVRFRASGNPDYLVSLVASHSLNLLVQVLPPVEYTTALTEMCAADGLLVIAVR